MKHSTSGRVAAKAEVATATKASKPSFDFSNREVTDRLYDEFTNNENSEDELDSEKVTAKLQKVYAFAKEDGHHIWYQWCESTDKADFHHRLKAFYADKN